MRSVAFRYLLALALGFALHRAVDLRAETSGHPPLPDAIADLRTPEGLGLVQGEWRYHDTVIREVAHHDVGPDLKASGPANRSFDFEPDARAANFDDSHWDVIPPNSLEQRRGHGKLSFGWYRLRFALPEKLGAFDLRGSTVVLELVVDDYAEVWVNGQLPLVLGQTGGPVAAGWNAPNRVVLTRDARPGEHFTIAVLGINGPLGTHPDTYLWVRSATLDVHAPGRLGAAERVPLAVDEPSPRLKSILPPEPVLERLAGGFAFTEGPVWVPGDPGHLLFSDPNRNTVFRLDHEGEVSVYLPKSGYTGTDIGRYRQPGSNGLALDPQGRLTLCQHGNRRVIRLEKNGTTTVLADRIEGHRLNSPNDLVYQSDGTLFFTDPPFGLPGFHDDPGRELPYAGVYSVHEGRVRLVARDFSGPNGLAFSPDERWLYVGNWDDHRKVVFRYPVLPDATLGPGQLFHDFTSVPGGEAIDGIKVDTAGNLYVCGPGGLWILDSEGNSLGRLRGPEAPHNLAWGDSDHRSLYVAAMTGIYRLRLNLPGSPSPDRPVSTALR